MNEEIWKPVVGWESYYEVSNLGRVRSKDRVVKYSSKEGKDTTYHKKGRIISLHNHKAGYKMVTLCGEGLKKKALVHRMVAEAFLPNPENLPQVNHRDNIKDNNKVDNLEWVTNQENATHAVSYMGTRRTPVIGVKEDGTGIFLRSMSEGKRYGISPSMIHHCLTGKRQHHKEYKWELFENN